MHTNVLCLNQYKYISKLLSKCHMVTVKYYDTPLVIGKSLRKQDGIPLVEVTLYKNVVEGL